MSAGIRTSEFRLAVVLVLICAAVLVIGIHEHSALLASMALLSKALIGTGYAVARAITKALNPAAWFVNLLTGKSPSPLSHPAPPEGCTMNLKNLTNLVAAKLSPDAQTQSFISTGLTYTIAAIALLVAAKLATSNPALSADIKAGVAVAIPPLPA